MEFEDSRSSAEKTGKSVVAEARTKVISTLSAMSWFRCIYVWMFTGILIMFFFMLICLFAIKGASAVNEAKEKAAKVPGLKSVL